MTKELTELTKADQSIVDPRQMQAINVIASKRVPKEARREHPGKGGKMFTYIDHAWMTETLQAGLGNMWSWEVLDYIVHKDDSVTVRGQLTLHLISKGGLILDRRVTEVGSFEPRTGMSISNAVASAASRCLCRCAMRMFGLGLEFYKKDEEKTTPDMAWTTLKEFGKRNKVWTAEFEKEYINNLKSVGISKDNILDRYEEAYRILATMMGKTIPVSEMPE